MYPVWLIDVTVQYSISTVPVYTQFLSLRNQEIRRHVPFLNWNPHRIVVGQNAWNQVKFMYRFLGAEFLMIEIWVHQDSSFTVQP